MITKEFADASAQMNEILGYLPKESVDKLPVKLKEFFSDVASKDYQPTINPNKSLLEQNLYPKTKDIITIIYREYWCTKEERLELDKKLFENDAKYEEELKRRYNSNNIFNKKETNKTDNEVKTIYPMELKKDRWYIRLFKYLKKIIK